MAGIDEAGRGSLVGKMFIACIGYNEELLDYLVNLGVSDSKLLTHSRREELYYPIVSRASFIRVYSIDPATIDSANLNTITWRYTAKMIKEAADTLGSSLKRVYVDAVGNKNRFRKYLIAETGFKNIVVDEKSDEKYPIVSAASILAKVLRDRHILLLSKKYGSLGSGYPSDPYTIRWLREYYNRRKELPPIVRRKWKTIRRVLKLGLEECKQKKLEEYLG